MQHQKNNEIEYMENPLAPLIASSITLTCYMVAQSFLSNSIEGQGKSLTEYLSTINPFVTITVHAAALLLILLGGLMKYRLKSNALFPAVIKHTLFLSGGLLLMFSLITHISRAFV